MMTKMEVTGSILLVSIKNLPLIVSRVIRLVTPTDPAI